MSAIVESSTPGSSHGGGGAGDLERPFTKSSARAESDSEFDSILSPKEQKRTIRKIDFRLLPILGAMYSISLVDRTNLGLALVAGMNEDLALYVGDRYNILVMIFFVAYIVCEIPSNLILRKVGSANWLSFLGLAFGIILLCHGFVSTWKAMAVLRALLGIMEAGFLPGCTYLITCWYTRFEVGRRLASFWMLAVVVGAFSPILAYALTLLAGRRGLGGWSWIFIIEGAITAFVAVMSWFVIIETPNHAAKKSFLSPEEKEFVIGRLNKDRGDADDEEDDRVDVATSLAHLKDWRLYIWGFVIVASMVPGYAYAYFLPTILEGLGFSGTDSILLNSPPSIIGAVIAWISGYLSDRFKLRGPFIALHQVVTVVGMLITVYCKGNGVRFFGAYLGIGFSQYCIPGVLAWQANNITSNSKRAVAAAATMMGSGLGGIIAGVSFKTSEAPEYTTGVFVSVGFTIVSVVLIAALDLHMWIKNKSIKAGKSHTGAPEGWLYTL